MRGGQLRLRTATFESLSKQSVQHGSAVVAERRRHVVVNDEVMRNIDVEPRRQHLQPAATAAAKFYTQRLRNSIFSLLIDRFIRPHRYAQHRLRPSVTAAAWSVCWSRPRALLKRLNRSRCR